jgi:hypothetical protein
MKILRALFGQFLCERKSARLVRKPDVVHTAPGSRALCHTTFLVPAFSTSRFIAHRGEFLVGILVVYYHLLQLVLGEFFRYDIGPIKCGDWCWVDGKPRGYGKPWDSLRLTGESWLRL